MHMPAPLETSSVKLACGVSLLQVLLAETYLLLVPSIMAIMKVHKCWGYWKAWPAPCSYCITGGFLTEAMARKHPSYNNDPQIESAIATIAEVAAWNDQLSRLNNHPFTNNEVGGAWNNRYFARTNTESGANNQYLFYKIEQLFYNEDGVGGKQSILCTRSNNPFVQWTESGAAWNNQQ
jgi:hypothetical protein